MGSKEESIKKRLVNLMTMYHEAFIVKNNKHNKGIIMITSKGFQIPKE